MPLCRGLGATPPLGDGNCVSNFLAKNRGRVYAPFYNYWDEDENMDFQSYLAKVKIHLPDTKIITLENKETTVSYEEVFKLSWFATKLKIFSFVAYTETISESLIKSYSTTCLNYARKNIKGLPIGVQNGVVSNSVLVSESVDDNAISFVTARPSKHYSAFEMPIVFDLSKNELFFYRDKIVWGMVYSSFINNYITTKFGNKA